LIASEALRDGDLKALATWVAASPEPARRLLHWCNTPLYNLARPFESLQEAYQVIDHRDLIHLAILASVRDFFFPDRQIDQYRRETLWKHCLAVGAVGSMIARTTGRVDPGVSLLAGALHDIGLCASERLAPDSFAAVIALVDELSPVNDVEQELLGWDHAELGEAVLNQWGMPESVVEVARHHHQPEHVLVGPQGATVGCVAIANYLCSRAGWSATGRHYLSPPNDRVFAELGIDAKLLKVLWQQLDVTLDSVAQLLDA
jgi:putative nucleotidyltransferase with HDIG domain